MRFWQRPSSGLHTTDFLCPHMAERDPTGPWIDRDSSAVQLSKAGASSWAASRYAFVLRLVGLPLGPLTSVSPGRSLARQDCGCEGLEFVYSTASLSAVGSRTATLSLATDGHTIQWIRGIRSLATSESTTRTKVGEPVTSGMGRCYSFQVPWQMVLLSDRTRLNGATPESTGAWVVAQSIARTTVGESAIWAWARLLKMVLLSLVSTRVSQSTPWIPNLPQRNFCLWMATK